MTLPFIPALKGDNFGLALNTNSIRVVTLSEQGVVQARGELISQEPLIEGEQLHIDRFSAALKKLLEEQRIREKYVTVCIPEKYAFSREYELPHLASDEIREALLWRIETIFPFSKNEIYWDYKVLTQDKEQIRVLITAIPKKIIEGLREGLQTAALLPMGFEPSAAILTRMIPPQSEQVVILELNNANSLATLVVNGTSTLTTTTNYTPETPPQTVLADILGSINSLILHLKQRQLPETEVKLYLTGEKASEQMAGFIGQQMKMPAELMALPGIEPAFNLAYLAAKQPSTPPENDTSINLLPPALNQFYQAQALFAFSKRVKYLAIGAGVTAAGVALAVLGLISLMQMQLNLALEAGKQVTEPVTVGQINIVKLMNQAQNLVKLYPAKESPEHLLSALLEMTPDSIVLTKIGYSTAKNTFELMAMAPGREAILQYKEVLEQQEAVESVHLPLTSLQSRDMTEFALSVTFKKGEI